MIVRPRLKHPGQDRSTLAANDRRFLLACARIGSGVLLAKSTLLLGGIDHLGVVTFGTNAIEQAVHKSAFTLGQLGGFRVQDVANIGIGILSTRHLQQATSPGCASR